MKKTIVKFYPTKARMAMQILHYVDECWKVEVNGVTICDTDDNLDFEFIGMPEIEWHGYMDGVKIKDEDGNIVILSSWDDYDIYHRKDKEEEINRIMEGIESVFKYKGEEQ